MPANIPAAFADEAAETTTQPQSTAATWIETALTAAFAVAAVLFVSFFAVVTGLV